MPSKTDIIFLIGLLMLGVGIAFQFNWAIALVVIGGVFSLVAVAAKMRGND